MGFRKLVKEELLRARQVRCNMPTYHDGLTVLWEEFEELRGEVFLRPENRSRSRILEELVQIGATAQRFAEDMGLLGGGEDNE